MKETAVIILIQMHRVQQKMKHNTQRKEVKKQSNKLNTLLKT